MKTLKNNLRRYLAAFTLSSVSLFFTAALHAQDAIHVNSSGYVGIGTNSPGAQLHVSAVGLTSTEDAFRMGGNGKFVIDAPNIVGGRMTVLQNGYVGIGTNNPSAPISIGNANGKEENPDSSMHITSDCILFGGNNAGKQRSSAQISAGKYSPNSLNICGMSSGTNHTDRKVDIWAEGGMGIQGFLHVKGWYNNPNSITYGFLSPSQTGSNYTASNINYSIIADKRIKAEEFNAVSDARIKQIQRVSDNEKDLQTLLQIEVTDYTHIDRVQKGEAIKKGFIAQQVEEVFPQAVSKSKDFIPNVYATASKLQFDEQEQTLTVRVDEAIDLQKGDLLKLITAEGEVQKEVTEVINDKSFVLANWKKNTDQLFVFGKQVDDFRAVDYDRVFTLGISAMQELYKEIETLKAQHEELRASYGSEIGQIKAELNSLKTFVKHESARTNDHQQAARY